MQSHRKELKITLNLAMLKTLRDGDDAGLQFAGPPEVPPMSMAFRLRAFIMFTVMVLAVGL